jgi:spore coat polysaccharide biosynthesis protein SpsF
MIVTPKVRTPKIVAIIEARYNSTRLPGKVLMPINGQSMLGRIVQRLKLARTLDDIVVATTESRSDDAVVDAMNYMGARTFRGSETDVLDRVVKTAESADADIVVEVTGDCPLIDPGLVDKIVGDFLVGGADFVSNILPHTTPRGTDVRVFRAADLAEINRTSMDPADHEHVSLHFWEHLDRYVCRNVEMDLPDVVSEIRLTVDTAEDLKLVRAIYSGLYDSNPAFSLVDVLDFLNSNPNLLEINRHVEQKKAR